MDNPCETCLVQACCTIPNRIIYVQCGCDEYEIYRTWQTYNRYCSHGERLTQLMMDHDPRMKAINIKNKQL